jgi:release factor glutamine methyltransferase
MNPTLDLINTKAQLLSKLGFTNSKQEIIWYLEQLDLLTMEQLYTNNIILNNNINKKIEFFYNERKQSKPYQYIIKQSNYYGRDFYIDERVLIPRPETEVLIEYIKNKKFNNCLEIGVGSGIISITLLLESIAHQITATDISQDALNVAEHNFKKFHLTNYTLLKHNILTDSVRNQFDLVISNPPYITQDEYIKLPLEIKNYEPQIALTDHKDGLVFYQRFSQILNNILNPNGVFISEISSTIDIHKVVEIFKNKKYQIKVIKDLSKNNRAIIIYNDI